jgi:hypothetical protein
MTPPTRPLLLLLAACTGDPDVEPPTFQPLPLDDVLRLNHVQSKGTHNSYHLQPATVVHPSHAYSHAPLYEQLSEQGVRQLELDLHWHEELGLQVFHLPGIDAETTCLAFADCLAEIRRFSDDHLGHLPVLVWLEPKHLDMDFLVPELGDLHEHWADLDRAIFEGMGSERLLTPDQVRGDHATLPEALASEGWPVLGEVRGKVIFALLDSGESRDSYLGGELTLEGRPLFVDSSEVSDPFAAFFKDVDTARGTELALAGFITTDNVAGISDAPEENQARQEAQRAAGVHFLATDIPAPVEGREDALELGAAVVCNPVSAPEGCEVGVLEPGY